MCEKTQKGGFVLDLVKTFNCIPRRPLMKMMLNLGVLEQIVTFWFLSLANLTRLPQFEQRGYLKDSLSGVRFDYPCISPLCPYDTTS